MNLFDDTRQPLGSIIKVPKEITSVYSLDRHIWRGETEEEVREAKKAGKLRHETVQELLIGPVRDFFIDLFDHIRSGDGQGWWVQAEFGSGKSHLLSASTILALGGNVAWDSVEKKEKDSNTPKRESLVQFRDDICNIKLFPVSRSLVGVGGSSSTKGLIDYILETAAEYFEIVTGKPFPVYPEEHLADRFLERDLELYREELKKFLSIERNLEGLPKYSFERLLEALRDPEERQDAGAVLWKFYRNHLQTEPKIPVDQVDRLEHCVRRILSSGYDGVFIVLDEVSEYMEKDATRRYENEDTLLTISHTLAKERRLPVWCVCAAQTAIEAKQAASKIIAPDRLKQYELLRKERSYYEIVLKRTRRVKKPELTDAYFDYYKRIVPWPANRGLDDFRFFFPVYPEAIDVIRVVSSKLTTARSALHFLLTALQRAVDDASKELLSLWNTFEEMIGYEEAPSGGMTGVISIRTKFPEEYNAYDRAKKALEAVTSGHLKVYRDRAQKVLNTLFLYRLAERAALSPEDVLNAVMEPRKEGATVEENVEHYATLLEEMSKRVPQVVKRNGSYRFEPIETVDFRVFYDQARNELRTNDRLFAQYFGRLLAWSDDKSKTQSLFAQVAPDKIVNMEFLWHNQERRGRVGMRDLSDPSVMLPYLNTPDTDDDFLLMICARPVPDEQLQKLLSKVDDPRVVLWTPRDLTTDEREELASILAYARVADEHGGKQPDVVDWAERNLRTDIPRGLKCVESIYNSGKMISRDQPITPSTAGGLSGILERTATQILDTVYKARSIECPRPFKRNDAPKLINGIVRYGEVREDRGQNASAAENFAVPFGLAKSSAPKKLNPADSPFYRKIRKHVETGPPEMLVTSFYKNFCGLETGLTKCMVDIYLTTLVQEGLISLERRDGSMIDRSNIEDTDFSISLLSSIRQAVKPTAPQFWERVKPFIEVLIGKGLGATYDEKSASEAIQAVRRAFEQERKRVPALRDRIHAFFSENAMENPFETLLGKLAEFFRHELRGISRDEDVAAFARAVSNYLGKPVEEADQQDVKRFREDWGGYHGLINNFDQVRDDVRAAIRYVHINLPIEQEFNGVREAVNNLSECLNSVEQIIYDEAFATTQFQPPLKKAREKYYEVYREVHSRVLHASDELIEKAKEAKDAPSMQVLNAMGKYLEIASGAHERGKSEIEVAAGSAIQCDIKDDTSLLEHLQGGPVCGCGIRIDEAGGLLEEIKAAAEKVSAIPDAALNVFSEFLLNHEVQEKIRAEQDAILKPLLDAGDVKSVKELLLGMSAEDQADLAKRLKRILSGVRVKRVALAEFRPSIEMVSRNEVEKVVEEFRQFLLKNLENPEDVLDMR